MNRILAAVVVGSCFSSACGGATSSAETAPKGTAAPTGGNMPAATRHTPATAGNSPAVAGNSPGAAGQSPCKLFTPVQVAKYIGEPVSPGSNAAGGCQWVATAARGAGRGGVTIVVVAASDHTEKKSANGSKEVPDVGVNGFVSPELGGWVAGAIVGTQAIKVSVVGVKASEASAIALLKQTIWRRTTGADRF